MIVPQKCPVFGIPLVSTGVRGSGPRFNSPTLDRIDSAKGYTPGNVWVISHRANSLKSNASLEELRKLVAAIENTLIVGLGLSLGTETL